MREKNLDKTKTPDFLWDNKYWEIKYSTTEKAVDSALRKGMKQIKYNPGGVVLYFGNKNIDIKKLKTIISSRLGKIRNVKRTVDIIIIYAGKKFFVFRYK